MARPKANGDRIAARNENKPAKRQSNLPSVRLVPDALKSGIRRIAFHCPAAKEPHDLSSRKIHIIGIGDDGLEGLTAAARQIDRRGRTADRGRGNAGPSARRPASAAACCGATCDEAVETLERYRRQRVVVLASGDPLFYGVARYLCDKLGKDRFEVVPHVSSMQLAFARVKESWEEAYLTNLANHPLEHVLEKIRVADQGRPVHQRGRVRRRPSPGAARSPDRLFFRPTSARTSARPTNG